MFIISFAINPIFSMMGNVILLQGKITDISGNPIGVKFQFVNSEGKKYFCKSNSTDGVFQQILQPGESYTLTYDGHYAADEASEGFTLPSTTQYTEITKNFKLKKVDKGYPVLNAAVFKANDSEISDKGKASLLSVKEFMIFQRKLELNLTIEMNDCQFKLKTIKEKIPGSKKTKTIKISVQEQMDALYNARVSSIQKFFSDNGLRERSFKIVRGGGKSVSEEPKKKTSKKGESKKGAEVPNVVITVDRIMNL